MWSRFVSVALGGLAVATGCQAILGIDDKQLDPKYAAGDSGLGGTGGTTTTLAPVPPTRPDGPAVPSGSGATRWFAARRIYLGSVDPASNEKDETAWRRIGHDIDGECTTPEIAKSDSSSTCSKPPDSSLESLEDGDDCRDNAMGKLMAVGLKQLSNDFELQQHKKLENAESGTYLLKLEDLDEGADDPYVRGSLYVTVPRNPAVETAPIWDGSDRLVVDVATLKSAADGGTADSGADDGGTPDSGTLDAGSSDATTDAAEDADANADGATAPPSATPFVDDPAYVFDGGYLSGNVWVSGDFRETPKALPLFVLDRITEVETATVTLVARLSSTHDSIERSALSAAVATPEIQAKFGPIALELAFCVKTLADTLINSFVLPGRDLGNSPPTFQTPGVPCYAMSIGWAFDWQPVKPPQWSAPGKYKALTCN